MEELCDTSTNSSPTWGLFDVFKWKVVPESFGGGRAYIQRFKDAWVVHNKLSIKATALKYSLPVQLLAGVCWIETGGDPNFIDRVVFEVRSYWELIACSNESPSQNQLRLGQYTAAKCGIYSWA